MTGRSFVASSGQLAVRRRWLARYTKDGQPDPDFQGRAARFVLDLSGTGGYDDAVSVIIANGGDIVTAGSGYDAARAHSFDWLVARFTPKGALDTTFDGDGKLFINGISANSVDAAFRISSTPAAGSSSEAHTVTALSRRSSA